MSSSRPISQYGPASGDHPSTSEQSETKRSRHSGSSNETVTRSGPGQGHAPRQSESLVDGSISPHGEQSPSPITTSPTSSRAGPSRGGRPESLTVRRREANRLAAQRFRSRKKGYQESLEEKVRELQEENALLQSRLDGRHDMPLPLIGEPLRPSLPHSASTDWTSHGSAADIRMAALDSANRRLQEENRALEAEVQRVSGELEMWRRWASQNREKPMWPQEPAQSQPPSFTRAQSHDAVPRPLSAFSDLRSSTLSNHMAPPVLPPPLSLPGVNSTSSSASSSSSVRLPPMRLTPPSTAHAILPSPNLPQPPNLAPTETKVPKPPLG